MTRKTWLKGLIGAFFAVRAAKSVPTNKTFISWMIKLGPHEQFPELKRVLMTLVDGKIISKLYIYPGKDVESLRKFELDYYSKKYSANRLEFIESTNFENIKGQLYAFVYLETNKAIEDRISG